MNLLQTNQRLEVLKMSVPARLYLNQYLMIETADRSRTAVMIVKLGRVFAGFNLFEIFRVIFKKLTNNFLRCYMFLRMAPAESTMKLFKKVVSLYLK